MSQKKAVEDLSEETGVSQSEIARIALDRGLERVSDEELVEDDPR